MLLATYNKVLARLTKAGRQNVDADWIKEAVERSSDAMPINVPAEQLHKDGRKKFIADLAELIRFFATNPTART